MPESRLEFTSHMGGSVEAETASPSGRPPSSPAPPRRMARRWVLRPFRCFALTGMLLGLVCARPTWSASTPGSAQSSADAKQHFQNGVRLFQDHNYVGALVEFDASYQLAPTASALQNVAVCQKELFRYADAIASLERMLAAYSAELPPEDRRAAEDAIREMSSLLGTLVIRTTPDDARVTIDDKVLEPNTRKRPIRLASGEYQVTVEAPGYESDEQSVRIVSQKERVLEVALKASTGTLVVRAGDSQAAIAIDGVRVGHEEWTGALPPGPHEVTVYTAKLRHRTAVMVLAGHQAEVNVRLAEKDDLPPAYEPTAPRYVPPEPLHGWFGYAIVSAESIFVAPVRLDGSTFHVNSAPDNGGVFGGVSAGYRFSTLWSAEFVANVGARAVHGCISTDAAGCEGTEATVNMTSARFGLAGRIMTPAHRARIYGTAGFGVVTHRLTPPAGHGSARTALGPYGQAGVGVEVNFGRFLADAGIVFGLDGTSGLGLAASGLGQPIDSVGLELRFGYGQW